MAKQNFSKGDYVNAKKWSGASFLGMYEHCYNDGSHCVIEASTGKRFNVLAGKLKAANEEEVKEIKRLVKENDIKPRETVSDNLAGKNDSDLEAALAASEETEATESE